MASNYNIINSCLKFVLSDAFTGKFMLDDVYLKDDIKSDDETKALHLKLIKEIPALFFIHDSQTQIKIQIEICQEYKKRKCDACNFLHICEYVFRSSGCKKHCRLDHTLDTEHNRQALKSYNIDAVDYAILEQVFKKYYFIPHKADSNDNRVGNLNRSQSMLSDIKRPNTVEITFSEDFIKKHNQDLLFMVFSNPSTSGGSAIFRDKCKFDEKALKAVVCYRNANYAERVANKKIIEFDGFQFHVRMMEDANIKENVDELEWRRKPVETCWDEKSVESIKPNRINRKQNRRTNENALKEDSTVKIDAVENLQDNKENFKTRRVKNNFNESKLIEKNDENDEFKIVERKKRNPKAQQINFDQSEGALHETNNKIHETKVVSKNVDGANYFNNSNSFDGNKEKRKPASYSSILKETNNNKSNNGNNLEWRKESRTFNEANNQSFEKNNDQDKQNNHNGNKRENFSRINSLNSENLKRFDKKYKKQSLNDDTDSQKSFQQKQRKKNQTQNSNNLNQERRNTKFHKENVNHDTNEEDKEGGRSLNRQESPNHTTYRGHNSPEETVKQFEKKIEINNILLSVVTDKYFPIWKNALFELITKNNSTIKEQTNDHLIINCRLNPNIENYDEQMKIWDAEIDKIIISFLNEFETKKVSLNDYEEEVIKEETKKFNKEKGFSIGFRKWKQEVTIIAKSKDLAEFFTLINKSKSIGIPILKGTNNNNSNHAGNLEWRKESRNFNEADVQSFEKNNAQGKQNYHNENMNDNFSRTKSLNSENLKRFDKKARQQSLNSDTDSQKSFQQKQRNRNQTHNSNNLNQERRNSKFHKDNLNRDTNKEGSRSFNREESSTIKEYEKKIEINNILLSVVTDKYFPIWKNALFDLIQNKNSTIKEHTSDHLIIKCTLNLNIENYDEQTRTWDAEIDKIITSFINEFETKKVSLDDYEEEVIKEEAKKFNKEKGFSIGYRKLKQEVTIIAKSKDLAEFFTLINKSKSIEIPIPKNMDKKYFSLIHSLVDKLKIKYSQVESIIFDETITESVFIKGSRDDINELKQVIIECLTRIRNEKIKSINDDVLKCSHLLLILESIAKEKQLLCKFDLPKDQTSSSLSGVFVIYFHDCPKIDSHLDEAFTEMNNYAILNLVLSKLNLTKHVEILENMNWLEFKINTLNHSNDVTYYLSNDELILFGKKEIVMDLESKVRKFLKDNKPINSKRVLPLDEDNVLYFKYVNSDFINKLEENYLEKKIKFEYRKIEPAKKNETFEMIINDCPEELFQKILFRLENEGSLKQVHTFNTIRLPGLAKVLDAKNAAFKQELKTFEKTYCCCVNYEICSNETSIVNNLSKVKSVTSGTKKIGNCTLSVEKGNILISTADVIVNSTVNSLELESAGILSQLILDAAGNKIQLECKLKYPNGITFNDVAVTSANNLNNYKKIYHVACPPYNRVGNLNILNRIIRNCLNQLKKDNLRSICIPAVGTGNLNYPIDEASESIIDVCRDFLKENINENYKITIVINEKELSNYNHFEKALKQNIPDDLAQNDSGCITKEKAKVKIITNENQHVRLLFDKFMDIVNSYILNETIKNEIIKSLDDEKLKDILKITPEIEVRKVDVNEISLKGFKDDVIHHKNEIQRLLLTHFEEETKKVDKFEFPDTWTNTSIEYQLVKVSQGSREYSEVEKDFIQKMKSHVTIAEIERIQNQRLFKTYLVHKTYIKNKNNGDENEKILYHGTDEKNIKSICENGFNRSFAGINATKYGQGCYFAVESQYSDAYARKSQFINSMRMLSMYRQANCSKMFRCRVLVGSCTVGNSSMKVPPDKSNGEKYDSTCDSENTIFVSYHDNQCYPEYLITYY